MPELLQLGDEGVDRIDWTSGYFSLDQANQRRLLDSPAKEIKVVCASPLVCLNTGFLIITNVAYRQMAFTEVPVSASISHRRILERSSGSGQKLNAGSCRTRSSCESGVEIIGHTMRKVSTLSYLNDIADLF